MAAADERWVLTLEVPAGTDNAGRFVARLVKHLKRAWGIHCRAVGESAEVRRLQAIISGLTDRVAAQAELLARRAEGTPDDPPGDADQADAPRPARRRF
jgi:hypothetical protein